jgi:hypothetical protein
MGCWILALSCIFGVAIAAQTAPPPDVTYQGLLLDSVGDPVPGPVNIEVGVWDQPTGGTRLYGETHSGVVLVDGVFNLLLGTGSAQVGIFDADLFAAQNRYLEVVVNGEMLQPRQPFSSVAYALQSEESEAATFADTAGDADTVDGSHAAALDQSAHVSDTGNPHSVTAAQVGAVTSSTLTAHEADASAHHAKTTTFADLTDQATDGQIPSSIARDSELTWSNLSGIPAGFNDNIDDDMLAGLGCAAGQVAEWNGSAWVCGIDNIGGGAGDGYSLDAADGSPIDAVYVDNDGKVGIGTTTPQSKLSLGTDLNPKKLALWDGVNDFYGFGTDVGRITFYANDTEGMTLNSLGWVGVGTPSPAARLEVRDHFRVSEASSSDFLLLRTDGAAVDIEAWNSPLYVNATSGQETYLMGGNVGVGTSSPGHKLDVEGNVFVNGTEGFNAAGEDATLMFGHPGHAIRGEYGTGVIISTYGAGDVLTVRELTGQVDLRGNLAVKDRGTGATLLELGAGLDYAEGFNVSDESQIGPGTVLAIDPKHPGELTIAREPYDRRVAGIVSGAKGLGSGVRLGVDEFDYDVALAGRVYCNVDATRSGIEPGDLLTTASTPGHAMKATDHDRAQGAILGKAMQGLEKGQKGQVLVLVSLQ